MVRFLLITLLLSWVTDVTAAESPKSEYVVEQYDTVSIVAIRLYGKMSMWKKIVEWNELKSPYGLKPGRKLKLELTPTVSRKRGNRLVVARYIRLLNRRKIAATKELASLPSGTPSMPIEQEIPEENKLKDEPQFLAAVQQAQQEAKEENPEVFSADVLLNQGEKLFDEQKYKPALAKFRASQKLDPEPVTVWMYEVRTLKILKRNREARDAAKELVDRHPEMKSVPVIRALLPKDD